MHKMNSMNNPFVWKEEYSLGLEEIDLQHQEILNQVNRLWMERMSPMGKKAYRERVREILDFAQKHFDTEETKFMENNYPETQAHIIEHDFFLQKIKYYLRNDLSESVPELLDEVVEFLEGWLIHHLMYVDQKYKKFIRNE